MRIAHLSRIRGSVDGGISLLVEELLSAQRFQLGPGEDDRLAWLAFPDDLSSELRRHPPHLVHVHGLWSAPNRLLARSPALPAVIAPHGMLDPWALRHRRWRKRLAWLLFERGNLERAGALQALGLAELQSIRALGIETPVALIPNAVSLPAAHPADSPQLLPAAWPSVEQHVLLFLSRFHPKKGLTPLLKAWQSLANQPERESWALAFAGYGDEGALAQTVVKAQQQGELSGVYVLGPCFGPEKQACFQNASAFILPSYSEGLPMAALEAMAYQLPCLLSAACNLPEAFSVGAALPAEPDPEKLASSLLRLFALSSADRAAMGQAGRTLVATRFSWSQVAQQTLELYRWILGGGDRPGFVELT